MRADGRPYRTIKELVLSMIRASGGKVDYEAVTAEVLRLFPGSKWKKSHWAWYRSQLKRGAFDGFFSGTRPLLKPGREGKSRASGPRTGGGRGRAPQDPNVKALGDQILACVRAALDARAGVDTNLRFKLNRWVFSRLLQDEIRGKRPIKRDLWDSGEKSCQLCGIDFPSLSGVEIHRIDEALAYSAVNCQLLCRKCHMTVSRKSRGNHDFGG